MFLKEVSYAHQSYIYLIRNTKQINIVKYHNSKTDYYLNMLQY